MGTEQAEMQPWQVMMGQQRFQSRAGVVAVCRNGTIWCTFRFSVSRGFPPEFSVLPQKISENLRVGSPSDANSREMREFYKMLNVKSLYTREIFPTHEKHHIGT